MSWTDERINTLKKMWKEGKSAAEIAKTLGKGVTRNAVIGKAHRMGLSGRPSPIKKPVPVKKEAAKKEKPVLKSAPPAAPAKKGAKPALASKNPVLAREAEELKKIDKEMVQIGGGIALIDLTERMCKWPIGDPKEADFSFCGRGIRQGTPYCPEHAAMAYQTSSRRTAAAAARGAAAAAANQDKTVDEDSDDIPEDAADEAAEDEEDIDETAA